MIDHTSGAGAGAGAGIVVALFEDSLGDTDKHVSEGWGRKHHDDDKLDDDNFRVAFSYAGGGTGRLSSQQRGSKRVMMDG